MIRYEMFCIFYPVLFSLLGNNISAVPINNRLAGDPEVRCGQDSMIIAFSTINPFEGNVYVKGRFSDPNCKVVGNGQGQAQMQLFYSGSCGVRRRRQISPLGMTIDATVVIMFHKLVLTKVDRAFNIQCFYMQGDKSVTASLDVSMITTLSVTGGIRMPNCSYEVLKDGPNGTPVRYTQIGDAVYHKWNCFGGDVHMLCIMVHTCIVDDGQGQVMTLLDGNGCAQDKYLLQNLEYPSDTMAVREAHVFKFADKPTLYFNCQIRIVAKEGGNCQRPLCPEPIYGKRSVTFPSENNESHLLEFHSDMDVSANKLDILDIEELKDNQQGSPFVPASNTKSIWCLSETTAMVFACLIGALTLCCLTLMVVVFIFKTKKLKYRST